MAEATMDTRTKRQKQLKAFVDTEGVAGRCWHTTWERSCFQRLGVKQVALALEEADWVMTPGIRSLCNDLKNAP